VLTRDVESEGFMRLWRTGRLALAIVALTRGAEAQSTGRSLQDIIDLLAGRVTPSRVAQRAKEDCIAFPIDAEAESKLTSAGASRELIASLRTSCFTGAILEVVSEPTGVDLAVDGRTVGKTPYRARVTPTSAMRLQVRRGEQVQSFDAEIPPGMQVRVAFDILEDTIPWPPERSARQIADDLGIMRQWTPPVPMPHEPVAPGATRSGMRALLVGVIGGGIAFAAASMSPTPCHDKQVAATDSYLGDKLYPAGSEVDLGLKPACAGGIGGGVAIVSSVVARQLFNSRHRSRVRAYEAAKAGYREQVSRWEASTAREREVWLASNSQVNAVLARQTQERQGVQAGNALIKRRNAARSPATRTATRITPTTPLRP
jgi:hypothetical protein